MLIKIILTVLLAILSGILGRLGGRAKDGSWYDFISNTRTRDIGSSLLSVITFILWFGFYLNAWWIYLIVFGLHWGALSTYWDKLFNGANLWFSGFMTGLCLLPLLFSYKILIFLIIRAILLAVIWGTLNRAKYDKILFWRRDIAEEFLRYFSLILTYIRR